MIILSIQQVIQYLFNRNVYILEGFDDRQSLIRVHEQVNALSDASYATLKHMAIHLNMYVSQCN
jgi:hypothetical protein